MKFTSPAAVLIIKGTIAAHGRIDAPIVFDGVDASMGGAALQISAHGAASVNMSHATFRNFGQAVGFECCWSANLLWFQDCVFEQYDAAVGGDNGMTVVFLRCEFANNMRPVTGGYFQFDGCFFHSQESGAVVGGSTFTSCVFMNHTGLALGAPDATITDSLFVWNDIAVRPVDYARGPVVLRSSIINNRLGMMRGSGVHLSDVNLCGNTDSNFVLLSEDDARISRCWLGTASHFEAYKFVSSSTHVRFPWNCFALAQFQQISTISYFSGPKFRPLDIMQRAWSLFCFWSLRVCRWLGRRSV